MNAQPRQRSTGSTDPQDLSTRAGEAERAGTDEHERFYRCLHCGRQCDSFIRECPDCGGQKFRTGMADRSTETTGTQQFERMLARFNPYIPR